MISINHAMAHFKTCGQPCELTMVRTTTKPGKARGSIYVAKATYGAARSPGGSSKTKKTSTSHIDSGTLPASVDGKPRTILISHLIRFNGLDVKH